MGALTQLQLNAEVRAGLGNRSDLTDARITAGLNIAQARVSRFWDFQEMKLTATAQNSFSSLPGVDKYMKVPSNLKTVHTLVLLDGNNSRKLIEKPWRWTDKFFPMPENDSRERSAIYSRWGYLFILIPVPDAQYTFSLKFTARPTTFGTMDSNAGTGAVTQLSDYEEKDDVLINLTLEYFWRSFGRVDKANEFLKSAYTDLELAKKKDDDRPDMDATNDLEGFVEGAYWNDPFIRSVTTMG